MLSPTPDADGLNDRQLVDFPPEWEMLLDQRIIPMLPDTPKLQEIFEIITENHDDTLIYTLEYEAYKSFRDIHDKLVNEKLKSTNENAQGIRYPRPEDMLPGLLWLFIPLSYPFRHLEHKDLCWSC